MNRLRTQMRWIMIIIVLAFLLSTFLMYGSDSRSQSGGDVVEDYAVAEINGNKLMLSTLYENLRTLSEVSGGRDITSTDYQLILEDYAAEIQMAQEIRDSGISVSDAEVDQAMKEYVDQVFPTRESFYRYLERSGAKIEDYKRDLSAQMARQKFLEESMGTTVVSEDEAVEFYDGMKNIFFRQPAGYMVNLARFSTEGEAAKTRALLSGGSPWAEVTSRDTTASSDVIFMTEAPSYFSDGTFDGYLSPMKSLDIGVLSPVFEVASNDFAVGIKSERVEEKITDYSEVSGDIRFMLQQQKEREAANSFRTALLERADIVILDPSLFPSAEPADLQPVEPVTGAAENVGTSGDAAGTQSIQNVSGDAAASASQDVSE